MVMRARSRILSTYNIHFDDIYGNTVYSNFKIRRSEFKSFLDNVGATTIQFNGNVIDDVICTTTQDHIVSFSKQVGKGLLLFIPCIWGSTKADYLVKLLEDLIKGIVSYSSRIILEPPHWLDNLQFLNEINIRNTIEEIKNEKILPLNKKLEYYNKIKSILWLGNNQLANAINEFLIELGFQTLIDEIFEEDLWILDNEEKKIIVEIKSKNKNLSRQDISELDEHREARLVPNMTGLLIANTFLIANSLETKSQPFPSNVIKKAVNTNVVITRTIDLYRIFDAMERNEKINSKFLIEMIIGQKGWLTFRDNEIKVIR